jgi:hypothetical protein
VLNVVLPDDDGTAAVQDRPWDELAQRARSQGIPTTGAQLAELDYVIEFTHGVLAWLGESSPPTVE